MAKKGSVSQQGVQVAMVGIVAVVAILVLFLSHSGSFSANGPAVLDSQKDLENVGGRAGTWGSGGSPPGSGGPPAGSGGSGPPNAVSVSSNPSGANVYIDGVYKGVTPLSVNGVAAGVHTVKVTKSGYADVSQAVNVPPFGTVAVTVTLQSSGSGNVAAFVDQNPAASFIAIPGQSYAFSVGMKNSGSATWSEGSGYELKSKSQLPGISLGVNKVNPAQNVVFRSIIEAPEVPGSYPAQWVMAQNGAGFDIASAPLSIAVQEPSFSAVLDASFVSQSLSYPFSTSPATPFVGNPVSTSYAYDNFLVTGGTYTVGITMKNTGSTTWTKAGGFRLKSQAPTNNMFWGVQNIELGSSDSIAPGQSKMFVFNIIAPSPGGTYNFQWSMAQIGKGVFGDYSPNTIVNVLWKGGCKPQCANKKIGDSDGCADKCSIDGTIGYVQSGKIGLPCDQGKCKDKSICTRGLCRIPPVACGHDNQVCCSGNQCAFSTSYTCNNQTSPGVCQECGGWNKICCTDAGAFKCDNSNWDCTNKFANGGHGYCDICNRNTNMCGPGSGCGHLNEPCCPPGNRCAQGTCTGNSQVGYACK